LSHSAASAVQIIAAAAAAAGAAAATEVDAAVALPKTNLPHALQQAKFQMQHQCLQNTQEWHFDVHPFAYRHYTNSTSKLGITAVSGSVAV